jgi:ketosteroid isomerase-like protein
VPPIICPVCRKQISTEDIFCYNCGRPNQAPTMVPFTTPGVAPVPQMIYQRPYYPPKRRTNVWIVSGIIGLLAIGVIVVLLLGFAVGPKWFVEGNDSADAKKVVQDFFGAMQKGDANAIMALVDSASLEQMNSLSRDIGYDDAVAYNQSYINYAYPEKDLEITGLKLQVTVNGDTATVKVVGGNATYTDPNGDVAGESYTDETEVFSTTEFTVKKIDGIWYLQTNYVPHKDIYRQWIVGQPSYTVDAYFKALQENRQLDALNLYDSTDLETTAQEYGMTLEEFKAQMASASSDTGQGSIVFENLAYKITVDGDKATANITSGTIIMTDETGKSESQDMTGTNISMVKRDGKWYLKLL